MKEQLLDFSFRMEGINRQLLLEEAARELDARKDTLGASQTKMPKTPEGTLVRAIIKDIAKFGPAPTVHKITDRAVIESESGLPFHCAQIVDDNNFYWLRVPLILWPRRHWAFNRLEVALQFSTKNPDPYAQPKVYHIFPERKFSEILAASASVKVHLGEDLDFAASTAPLAVDLGYARGSIEGGVKAGVDSQMSFVVGPLYHRSKKVIIDHNSTGTNEVFWRLEDTDFFEKDDPQLTLIVEVPRITKDACIMARMQAARYFSYASAGLQQAIQCLPEALQTFFKHGAPLEDQASWDMTPLL
jgi:hypothetical protein